MNHDQEAHLIAHSQPAALSMQDLMDCRTAGHNIIPSIGHLVFSLVITIGRARSSYREIRFRGLSRSELARQRIGHRGIGVEPNEVDLSLTTAPNLAP